MTAASPGPAPVTPGQRAFATYYGLLSGAALLLDESWNMQSAETREAWEAAAQAAIGAAEDWTTMLIQRDEARAVIAEMCAHWERIGTTREEDALIPQWRQRAGLDGS